MTEVAVAPSPLPDAAAEPPPPATDPAPFAPAASAAAAASATAPSADPAARPKPYLTIRATTGWTALNLREVWQFRDLMFTMAARDLRVRYKQTALGVVWIVLQPLIGAGVFAMVFGQVAKMPSEPGVPYFIFSFAGLLAWNIFSGTVGKTSSSMVGNAHLISKVYFPRLILPLSGIVTTIADFGIAYVALLAFQLARGVYPGWGLALLPVWILLLVLLALGVGLISAALMVYYRDVSAVVGLVMGLLVYASPVAYSSAAVPAHLRTAYQLNPVTPLLDGFKWSLLGRGEVTWWAVGYATAVAAGAFVLGALMFKRMERRFVDVI